MIEESIYILIGAVLLLELALQVFSVWVIVPIFERRLPFETAPRAPEDDIQTVTIVTPDGLELKGSLYLPEQEPIGLIVFCPEFQGNRWTAMVYCRGLLNSGFAVLAFDFRGQGESEVPKRYEPLHWCTEFEIIDLQSVLSFVRAHPDLAELPLGLMGVSRGAGAALAVAAGDEQVQCVVADSAFSTDTLMVLYAARWVEYYAPRWFRLPEWHLRISCRMARSVSEWRRKVRHPALEEMLPQLHRRNVLLIAGMRDSYVPCESSRRICNRMGGEATVWYVPGAKHNSARQTKPEEYDKRVLHLFLEMVPIHQYPPTVSISQLTSPVQAAE